MSMLTIYTPQNGEYLRDAFNAMAMFMKEETFQTAMDCFLVFAVIFSIYQFVNGNKIQSLMRYFLTTFFTLYILIGLHVSVNIQDMQQEIKGLTVDNVPIGIALPASLISQIGRGLTLTLGDVFRMPDDLDYNISGMIFGARTWLSATSANFSSSPELAQDVSTYIRQCIFSAKLLGSRQITASELIHHADLNNLYFNPKEGHSPIFRTVFHDGINRSCGESAENLKCRVSDSVALELKTLSNLMSNGDQNRYNNTLEAVHHEYYKEVSLNAAQILTQNMLVNATRDAARDAFAFNGADVQLMNYTNTASMQKMHVAEANSFWLASYRLPYYMTVFWMLTVCIFPLVFLISLFPATQSVYKIYLQSQAYLWSWPPLFTFIHFFVSMASSKITSLFMVKTGGVSFSNIDSLANIQSNFAYTAGALAASVPFLAYYLTKGLGAVLSQAAQHFGGIAQSLSTSEAQSVTQGNVSMANYSGWNMNYDNTNVHKFDSNYAYAADKITAQNDNGALISRMPDGSMVSNSQPAMSTAAVSVHGTDRVMSSLNQSAQESLQSAEQHRTAADHHFQQAFSELSQYNDSQNWDVRQGAGVSQTDSNSYHEDIRSMKESIQQYNAHHDRSKHIGLDQALTGRVDSSHAILGKVGKWVTGVSVDGQGSLRHGNQWSSNVQDFFNSSEGHAFSSAFDHMRSSAHTQHLDVADATNLSGAEQIASHLSKGESLLTQASHEYSKGLHYQTASSQAKEHANSIEANLSQAFHDYVNDHYGAEGQDALLRTDSESIRHQQALATEFMRSKEGQSLIERQVSAQLDATSTKVQSHAAEQDFRSSHLTSIDSAHQKQVGAIHEKMREAGIHHPSKETQTEIAQLRHNAQETSLYSDFNDRNVTTKSAISHQKEALTDIHSIQKRESEHKNPKE